MKNSFVFYSSYKEQIELLTDEQAGVLLKTIMRYTVGEELPQMDGVTQMAFAFIRSQMDKDFDRYNKICERRKESGKLGGRPKANGLSENQNNQMVFEKSKKSKSPPDNDNEDEDEDDNDKDIYKESDDSLRRTEVRRAVEAWNSLGFNQVKRISSSSTRYKMLSARIEEYGIDDVLAAIEKVRQSDFLKGGGKTGWVIDLEWFARPNNFPKVLEGSYDNRDTKGTQDNSQKGWQSWGND